MLLVDPLAWFRSIFRPNRVFTFLYIWTKFDGYIRTLDSPFLILEIMILAIKPYGRYRPVI